MFFFGISIPLLIAYCSYTTSFNYRTKIKYKSTVIPKEYRFHSWKRKINLAQNGNYSIELSESINVPTPSYVQVLSDDTLTVTSFSLFRKGSIFQFDLDGLHRPKNLNGQYLWPNELTQFKDSNGNQIMLIPDGFLTPSQNDGAIYALCNPTNSNSKPIRITKKKPGWFYHRAVHVKLPDNMGEGILTARANKPLFHEGNGELVWLHIPKQINLYSDDSYCPWNETILLTGPDVMFEVIDLDHNDRCIEVICTHFFGKKLSVTSLTCIESPPFIKVVDTSFIDTIGRPYGLCLADLSEDSSSPSTERKHSKRIHENKLLPTNFNLKNKEPIRCQSPSLTPTHLLVTSHDCSYDLSSTLNMARNALQGNYPKIKSSMAGTQSINIVYPQEKSLPMHHIDNFMARVFDETAVSDPSVLDIHQSYLTNSEAVSGGALFAYALPTIRTQKPSLTNESTPFNFRNVSDWTRSTLFRGFKVRGWGGIFSPGAPGFPYVFRMPKEKKGRPFILLAGDCTGSAYIFAPTQPTPPNEFEEIAMETHQNLTEPDVPKAAPQYELAFEIECGSTVGSAAVNAVQDDSGDVNLYIPSYELNKVHVFRMSSNPSDG